MEERKLESTRIQKLSKEIKLFPYLDYFPKLGKNVFLASGVKIIGNVSIGNNSSFWYNSVIRGDVHYIKMGNKVNVQDGAVIHGTYQRAATHIGNNVSIGHRAIVHGCTLHDNVLIGMGAIVMDHAVVESNVLIAAGAVVLENTRCESGHIYAGVPAKPFRAVPKGQLLDEQGWDHVTSATPADTPQATEDE